MCGLRGTYGEMRYEYNPSSKDTWGGGGHPGGGYLLRR